MQRLTATFRIVTPLFLTGFQGSNEWKPELRAASVKGTLRYWLRAIDPAFREYENCLYGSAGEGIHNGQSRVLLRMETGELATEKWNPKAYRTFSHNGQNGVLYLGYSLGMKLRGEQVSRYFFQPDQTFRLSLIVRPLKKEEIPRDQLRKRLIASLWLLGHIGGLGYRARRGFGTVALTEWHVEGEWPELDDLPVAHQAKTWDEWVRRFSAGMRKLFEWFGGYGEAGHTVVSPQSRFYLAKRPVQGTQGASWAAALDQAGRLMQTFRRLKTKRDHYKLAAFGLPIQVRHRNGWAVTYRPQLSRAQLPGAEGDGERFASPVWIRVVEIAGESYPFLAFLTPPSLDGVVAEWVRKVRGKEESREKRHSFVGYGVLAEFQSMLKTSGMAEVEV